MRGLWALVLLVASIGCVGARESGPQETLSIELKNPDPQVLAQLAHRMRVAATVNQVLVESELIYILRVHKKRRSAEALFSIGPERESAECAAVPDYDLRTFAITAHSPHYALARAAYEEIKDAEVSSEEDILNMPQTPAVKVLVKKISSEKPCQ